MTDPLAELLSRLESGGIDRPNEGDPLAEAWRTTTWPRLMLRVWTHFVGDAATGTVFAPVVTAFSNSFDTVWAPRVEAGGLEIEPRFDPASIAMDRAALAKARAHFADGSYTKAAGALANLSRAARELLSTAIRAEIAPPGTHAALVAIFRAKLEAQKRASDRAAAEERARREAVDARMDAEIAPRAPGPWRSLAQTFERFYGVAFPLPLPIAVRVLHAQTIDGVSWDDHVTTSGLEMRRPLAERALGHVTAGFWGHGVNSNYFDYDCRFPGFLARLHLHTGGAYSDRASSDASVRAHVVWLGELLRAANEREVAIELSYDELSDNRRAVLMAPNGERIEIALPDERARTKLLATVRAFPLRT